METPYRAKGIFAHADFLERYEDTISSPSRKLSNKKFRKGAQIEANLGAIAKQQLRDKDERDLWASNSLFVNEEDHERYVKPIHGGRVISSIEGLRNIKARNDKEEEDELTRTRKELEVTERRHRAVVEKEENKIRREVEKAQKVEDDRKKKEQRARDKAERDEKKRIEEEAKEARRQEALSQGKKPRGRKRKIKAIDTQITQEDI